MTVTLILRDHDGTTLAEHEALVRRLAEEAVAGDPRARVTFERWEQYRNMREALDRVPHVVEAALEATRRVGLEPTLDSIRGGTDGSRLTEMGLPTPNVFAGGNDFHSVREWISVQDMAISAATVVELLKLWAEPDWRRGCQASFSGWAGLRRLGPPLIDWHGVCRAESVTDTVTYSPVSSAVEGGGDRPRPSMGGACAPSREEIWRRSNRAVALRRTGPRRLAAPNASGPRAHARSARTCGPRCAGRAPSYISSVS